MSKMARDLERKEGLGIILSLLKVEAVVDDIDDPESFAKLLEVLANIAYPPFWDDLKDGPLYDGYADTEAGREAARSEYESKSAWFRLHADLESLANQLRSDANFYL